MLVVSTTAAPIFYVAARALAALAPWLSKVENDGAGTGAVGDAISEDEGVGDPAEDNVSGWLEQEVHAIMRDLGNAADHMQEAIRDGCDCDFLWASKNKKNPVTYSKTTIEPAPK